MEPAYIVLIALGVVFIALRVIFGKGSRYDDYDPDDPGDSDDSDD
ncbi:MAG: hypothetical protein ACQESG_07640 [Nanobdellota archaeon]